MKFLSYCPRIEPSKIVRSVRVSLALGILALSGCATDDFLSTWKAPDATPLELRGEKVAAVVMTKDEALRHTAEDALAREISARGAQGIAMYTLFPNATPANEPATRAALEKANVQGVVAMRLVSIENKANIEPVTYLDPMQTSYWNGYYGYGLSRSMGEPVSIGTEVHSSTSVYVETMVYSLKQNKLVWRGQSKTVDPKNSTELVTGLAGATARALQKEGLLKH